MINVSRVLRSPRLSQLLTVYRSKGYFGLGGWIEEVLSPPYFQTRGVAWPSSAKEIEQVPEADRVKGMHTFATVDNLYVTREGNEENLDDDDDDSGLSDQVEWRGDRYKIIQILNYQDYGYCLSIGVRIRGM